MPRGKMLQRIDPRRWFESRRTAAFTIAVIVFLVVDVILGLYIIYYSVDSVEIDTVNVGGNISAVDRSGNNYLLISSESVHLLTPGGLSEFEMEGEPSDASIGDDTGAVVIANDSGTVFYYPPGHLTYSMSVHLEGDVRTVGVGEVYGTPVYRVENLALIVSNASGDHLVILSEKNGSVVWRYSFESEILCYGASQGCGYILLGIQNNTLYRFRIQDDTPRDVIALDGRPLEIVLSSSGINEAILYQGESRNLVVYDISEEVPKFAVGLSNASHNLVMNGETSTFFIQDENRILQITGGLIETRVSRESISTYTAAYIVNQVFVASGDHIYGYRGDRQIAIWETEAGFIPEGLATDDGADLVLAWGGGIVGRIDNSDAILGNGFLWGILGGLLMAEVVGFPIVYWWKKIVRLRRELAYVLLVSLIAGIAVSALMPDSSAIEWYGGEGAYYLVAASIAVISSLVCWRFDAGLVSLVIGFAIGIIAAIPVAITAHFLLSLSGYSFGDTAFTTITETMLAGLKMGILGGVIGLLLNRIQKWK